MDKRFFLALALTAVVVIATQWLFGTRSSQPSRTTPDTSTASKADSVKRPSSELPTIPSTPVVEERVPLASADSVKSRKESTNPPIPDTARISLPTADYQFSSLGATPIA